MLRLGSARKGRGCFQPYFFRTLPKPPILSNLLTDLNILCTNSCRLESRCASWSPNMKMLPCRSLVLNKYILWNLFSVTFFENWAKGRCRSLMSKSWSKNKPPNPSEHYLNTRDWDLEIEAGQTLCGRCAELNFVRTLLSLARLTEFNECGTQDMQLRKYIRVCASFWDCLFETRSDYAN